MDKKKQYTHLNHVFSPLIKIGTLLGQDLYVKLRGHDAEERERNFLLTQQIATKIIEGDVRNRHTERCHWTGPHTMECYCNE